MTELWKTNTDSEPYANNDEELKLLKEKYVNIGYKRIPIEHYEAFRDLACEHWRVIGDRCQVGNSVRHLKDDEVCSMCKKFNEIEVFHEVRE